MFFKHLFYSLMPVITFRSRNNASIFDIIVFSDVKTNLVCTFNIFYEKREFSTKSIWIKYPRLTDFLQLESFFSSNYFVNTIANIICKSMNKIPSIVQDGENSKQFVLFNIIVFIIIL